MSKKLFHWIAAAREMVFMADEYISGELWSVPHKDHLGVYGLSYRNKLH